MQITTNLSQESAELLEHWKSLAALVDAKLNECLQRLSSDCPVRLSEAIRYSLLAPGKRLRPVLCLLTSEALGGRSSEAMPLAAALEMVHCYSLIHDDLPSMDDDDLRRGRPTCHIQFDEATAILAGDGLQALAYETILADVEDSLIARRCCRVLTKAAGVEGMVGGQVDDLMSEKRGGDATLLEAIHRRKTGAMIRASVVMGAIVAGATEKQLATLANYGDCIGIAFQIVDDLLDVEGSAENTGKRTRKDQNRGKLTFPGIYGVESSRIRAQQYTEQAIAIMDEFGASARLLQQLARYITDRSH